VELHDDEATYMLEVWNKVLWARPAIVYVTLMRMGVPTLRYEHRDARALSSFAYWTKEVDSTYEIAAISVEEEIIILLFGSRRKVRRWGKWSLYHSATHLDLRS